MLTFAIEYALVVFQKGIFTFAAKEHRQTGGNPTLTINVTSTDVEWIITPLTQGQPDTNDRQPQKDRFDLYFLLDELRAQRQAWPVANSAPAAWGGAHNNQGTERAGGKTIKMDFPVGKVAPIDNLTAQVGIPSQAFTATANDLVSFMDIEYTPIGNLYATNKPQMHLGFQGVYDYTAGATSASNVVTISMSHAVYEAIRTKLMTL